MKRIYHTWDKWECYPDGFYETRVPHMTDEEANEGYRLFLTTPVAFEFGLIRVIRLWPNSCEHYLSNERMNRIAWLGQAAACTIFRLPSKYRSGYHRLTDEQKRAADELALKYLNRWLSERGEPTLTMEEAQSKTEMDLY
jgi:hypothetical protein